MCHAIVEVKSKNMARAFFPRSTRSSTSWRPRDLRWCGSLPTFVFPEPRAAPPHYFLKAPLLRRGTNRGFLFFVPRFFFPSGPPVNQLRGGFSSSMNNDTGEAQRRISGQGARAFYYPLKSPELNCANVPYAPSGPRAIRQRPIGLVSSHRFPGVTTPVPTANQDQAHLSSPKSFFRTNIDRSIFRDLAVAGNKRTRPIRRRKLESDSSTRLSPSAKNRYSLPKGQPAKSLRRHRSPSIARVLRWRRARLSRGCGCSHSQGRAFLPWRHG